MVERNALLARLGDRSVGLRIVGLEGLPDLPVADDDASRPRLKLVTEG
jgi:hypothetical protein